MNKNHKPRQKREGFAPIGDLAIDMPGVGVARR